MHIYNEQKLSDADLEMGNSTSLLALAMHEKTIVSYCSVETAALQCCLYSRNIVRLTQGFLSCMLAHYTQLAITLTIIVLEQPHLIYIYTYVHN